MDDLADMVAWVRAQLDEDERVAKAATAGPWRWIDPGGKVKQALVADEYRDGRWSMVLPCANGDVFPSVFDAKHIAGHDPARVLREVEAKRLLFVLASVLMTPIPTPEGYPEWARKLMVEVELAEEQAADKVMRLLALPYANRPGYREEWKP